MYNRGYEASLGRPRLIGSYELVRVGSRRYILAR